MARPRKITDIDVLLILFFAKQPLRTAEIAKKLGCTERTVRNRIRELKMKGYVVPIRVGKSIFYVITTKGRIYVANYFANMDIRLKRE